MQISYLITSYFCVGTELRFMKQLKVPGFENSTDSYDPFLRSRL